jgi:3-hydroxyacyl-[acyl-carrier-protein] dehydratase
LTLSVTITRSRANYGIGKAIATVEGKKVCEAELSFMIG